MKNPYFQVKSDIHQSNYQIPGKSIQFYPYFKFQGRRIFFELSLAILVKKRFIVNTLFFLQSGLQILINQR